MVIERFKPDAAPVIYRRLREEGRHLVEGVEYVASWVDLVMVVEVLRYEMFAPRIEIEHGARATVRSTMRELLRVEGQSSAVELVGTYTDELVLRSGAWQVARRTFRLRYEDDVPIPKRLGGNASRMSANAPSLERAE